VAGEALDLMASVSSPEFARLVDRSSDDSVSLRVELNFTDFILMALQ